MLLYVKSLGCGWGRLWSLTQLCWDESNGRSLVVKKPRSTGLGSDLLAQHLCFDKVLWQDKMYRNTAACLLGKTQNIVASPVATPTDRRRHVFRAVDFKTWPHPPHVMGFQNCRSGASGGGSRDAQLGNQGQSRLLVEEKDVCACAIIMVLTCRSCVKLEAQLTLLSGSESSWWTRSFFYFILPLFCLSGWK